MQIPASPAKGDVWGKVGVTMNGIGASRDLKVFPRGQHGTQQLYEPVRGEDGVWRSRDEFQVSLGKTVKSKYLVAVALRKALAFTPRSMLASHSTRHTVL